MHIIMHMPTRNVYVSDEDQNLFQEAAELAGGFSPAVSEALREYVKRRKLMRGGAEQVEVDLRTDGIDHRVSFMGRRLVKVQRDHEQGCRIDTVYATAREAICRGVEGASCSAKLGRRQGRSLVASRNVGQGILDGRRSYA